MKKHYYILSYRYSNGSASVMHITNKQFITKKDLDKTVECLKSDDPMIKEVSLISISYLGYMTEDEFNGD